MPPLLRLRSFWKRTRERILRSGNPPSLFNKTVARCAGTAVALISLTCFAAAIRPWDRMFEHTYGPVKGDWQDGISIAPLLLAILHNGFTAYYVFHTMRKIPSAVELVMDFLIWAALLPGLVFAIWGGTFNLWHSDGRLGRILCETGINDETWSRECFMALYHIGSLELAGIVFAFPLWFMHVFLFAYRIVEIRSQRKYRRQHIWMTVREMEQNIMGSPYPAMPRRPPQSYVGPVRSGFVNLRYYQ